MTDLLWSSNEAASELRLLTKIEIVLYLIYSVLCSELLPCCQRDGILGGPSGPGQAFVDIEIIDVL